MKKTSKRNLSEKDKSIIEKYNYIELINRMLVILSFNEIKRIYLFVKEQI